MQNEQAREIVARLRRIDRVGVPSILTEAADQIERLQYALEFTTRERDLARGEVCRLLARSSKCDPDYWLTLAVSEYPTPELVAESRNWDLYRKAATNG